MLASEPKPSVDEDTFLFLFLKSNEKVMKKFVKLKASRQYLDWM